MFHREDGRLNLQNKEGDSSAAFVFTALVPIMREVRQQTIKVLREGTDNDNLLVSSTRSQACVFKLRSSMANR